MRAAASRWFRETKFGLFLFFLRQTAPSGVVSIHYQAEDDHHEAIECLHCSDDNRDDGDG
jgi:hypothetical protein